MRVADLSSREIKQGATDPPLSGTITQNGKPFPLLGATIELRMRLADGTGDLVSGVVTNLDDGTLTNQGRWSYAWAAGDTSRPGFYNLELKVTAANGRVRYVPSGAFSKINVIAHL